MCTSVDLVGNSHISFPGVFKYSGFDGGVLCNLNMKAVKCNSMRLLLLELKPHVLA